MNTFKKGLFAGATALAMSMSVQASEVNVGGVVWDPDAVNAFPSIADFASFGSIFETAVVNPGDILSGRGKFERINSALNNEASFCPGCELTFTFTAVLDGFNGTPTGIGGSINGDFVFTDLDISIFVDHTPDYTGTMASAADGDLWLRLTSDLLSGTGTNLGSGSDTGSGSSLLDVIDGMAMGNFDTDTEAGGADMVLNSSFFDLGLPGELGGTFDLRGDSIPEPSTIALLGLGLLGFAGARKRKA
ncbi:MAG: PEP-CTERM sorting domain-containing protein [Colwellia sp.]|nr:PEP-CTERM sorting domain-containing protein [Colwellia sp.]MCW8865792.1 PEP-CTERM sorting domain-containing protein [Colwellia sp.]MCW9081810.1 PEP-CTERM sorting domain-containing protein [Colwellia sp.]